MTLPAGTLHIDGTTVHVRRLQFGLSQASLAVKSGFSEAVVRSVERSHIVDSAIPVRLLGNLADSLHLPLNRLLSDCPLDDDQCPRPERSTPAATTEISTDADLLAAALVGLQAPVTRTSLARGLDWTLPRVRAAIDSLTASLHDTPLRLHVDAGGSISLAARHPEDNATATRLATDRVATALTVPAARLAYRALHHRLRPQDVTHDAQPHLGFLRRAQLVTDAAEREGVVLSPIALAAFPDLDDTPHGSPPPNSFYAARIPPMPTIERSLPSVRRYRSQPSPTPTATGRRR
jgi:transcriptional regulator with XRE-family HTH domain